MPPTPTANQATAEDSLKGDLYAWSNIRNKGKTIKVGEKVNMRELDLPEADAKALVDQGVLRAMPYPVSPGDDTSPTEHFKKLAAQG